MQVQRLLAITAAAGWMATVATAQDAGFEIRVLGDVTPATPMVEIEVWAHFPLEDYAMNGARYSLRAGSREFDSYAECMYPLECSMWQPPDIQPTRIGMVQGQVHFPPPILADTRNPMMALLAFWRADDRTPRVVDLWTETTEFRTYIEKESPDSVSRLDRLVEGVARFRVLDRECYVDCDASGALDFTDFLCFQNLYAASDPLADCDLDGQLDIFDFLEFQNMFLAGDLFADFTGDAVLDLFDFLQFQNEVAAGCP